MTRRLLLIHTPLKTNPQASHCSELSLSPRIRMPSSTLKTGIRLSGGVSAYWVKRLDWFLSRKKSAWMQIIPLKEMEPESGPLVTKDVTR